MARPRSRSKKGGAGCLIPFGLIFAGAGLAAFYFLGVQFLENAATYSWAKAPCDYERVEIQTNPSSEENPFDLAVNYRYRFEGQHYVSTQVSRSGGHSGSEYEPLALRRKAMQAEGGGVCYVDPKNPMEAVLERRGLSSALWLLFPIPFLAIGIAVLYGGIRALRKGNAENDPPALDDSSEKLNGRRAAMVVGGIFFTIGLGLLWPLGIKPVSEMLSSNDWVETPCEVIWSRVVEHRGDDSTTYSPDIFYKYKVDGVEHRSNRYAVFSGSSSGRSSKVKIVNAYPSGSQQICYVDPSLPERAILKPGFSAMALLGLLPLIFVVVGLIAMVAGGKKKVKPLRAAQTGPVQLQPGKGRGGAFAFFGIFAVIWNTVIFGILLVGDDDRDLFATLFMIPFALIGIVLLLIAIYQFFGLFNPKPVITLLPGEPRLGTPFAIAWRIERGAQRLSDLKITIQGEEWSQHESRGRNNNGGVTRHEAFFAERIVELSTLSEIRAGEATFTIPEDLVPTLDLGSNKIMWTIVVQGAVPLWPDVLDRYNFIVHPAAPLS